MSDREINLDAARAARAEQNGKAPTMVLAGRTFTLPLELPFEFGELWAMGQTREGLKLLIGDEQWPEFNKCEFSTADLSELIVQLGEKYGVQGNGGTSGASSKRTGGRSRRTSGGSTRKT